MTDLSAGQIALLLEFEDSECLHVVLNRVEVRLSVRFKPRQSVEGSSKGLDVCANRWSGKIHGISGSVTMTHSQDGMFH